MAVNIPGVVAIVILYIIIAVIGFIAGKRGNKTGTAEEMFLANRNMGLCVCIMTSIATATGGGNILGTAEIVGKAGLVWVIFPPCAAISLNLACLFFIPKLNGHRFTTIVDPFQLKYGQRIGALLFIPEFIGCVFWQAVIFTALGSTLTIVLDVPMEIATTVSASVAIAYTVFGGFSSVAYTDIIQLTLIMLGIVLVVPFAIQHPAVNLDLASSSWIGGVPSHTVARYVDTWCSLSFGSLTWQALYQRAFACRDIETAKRAFRITSVMILIITSPSAVIGVIGRSTDWNMTDFQGEIPLSNKQWTHIYPMVLQYLCPSAVSVIGLSVVSAAVMSSADSIILATSSIFTKNIHHAILRPNASDREQIWVLRIAILCLGSLGAIVAVTVHSIFGLMVLTTDLMYIIQFPQLVCLLWIPLSNSYGSVCGCAIGFIMRILSGEKLLRLPANIKYPYFDDTYGQLFPFKTLCAVISFLSIVLMSHLANYLFLHLKIDKRYDLLRCFQTEVLSRRGRSSSNSEHNDQNHHELMHLEF